MNLSAYADLILLGLSAVVEGQIGDGSVESLCSDWFRSRCMMRR